MASGAMPCQNSGTEDQAAEAAMAERQHRSAAALVVGVGGYSTPA